MKRKSRGARQQATPRDEKSLMDELELVHSRIQSMIERALGEDDLSDDEWEEFWKMVDLKARILEAELKRELAEQNALLDAAIKDLTITIVDAMAITEKRKTNH
jgi:hypothetical protein